MKIDFGPFSFHLKEATVMRLLPLISDDPTFAEVKAALLKLRDEDNAPKD
jgi:hypothetical protein